MAIWKPASVKSRSVINTFGEGINVGFPPFEIADGDLTYVRNMDSHEYPAITTRYDRTVFNSTMPTLTSPNGIGERGNSDIHVLHGVYWSRWDVASSALVNLSSSLSSTSGDIQDFNTGSARYSIMMNSTQLRYWDGASTSSTSYTLGDGTTPFTKIFTVGKNRIFACKGATIFYCARYSINDWTTPNDAGSIVLAKSKGDLTGASAYNDKVIFFTQYSMHELFGTSPANYEIVDVEGEIGCVANKSIVKANKRLYWAWIDGIYEYNGGTPVKISKKVDEYFKLITNGYQSLIVAGSRGDYIYFAIPYNGSTTNNLLLVYDTSIQKWFVDTGNFVDFVTIGNSVYGLDSTGGIQNMRNTNTGKDNGTAISWEFITKPFITGTGQTAETVWDMSLLYKASTSATINVSYSTHATDNASTSFNAIAATSDFTLDGTQHTKRLIPTSTSLQNEPFYRLRFDGTGDFTCYRLAQNYRIKKR
jgi:hypothetical protein